jgi:hypothetical protein
MLVFEFPILSYNICLVCWIIEYFFQTRGNNRGSWAVTVPVD